MQDISETIVPKGLKLFICSFHAEQERESNGGWDKLGKQKGSQESMLWHRY